MNADKTACMVFQTSGPEIKNFNIKLENCCIASGGKVKFLGLQVDARLTWEDHCHSLAKKLNSFCYLTRSLTTVLGKTDIMLFYNGEIKSRILYGIMFWGCSAHFETVLIAQKAIVRCVAGAALRDSCRPLFRSLKILTVTSLYIFEICVYVFKNFSIFYQNSYYHEYSTRGRDLLCIRHCRLNLSKRHPLNMGPKIYNHLPREVKSSSGTKTFKKSLFALLLPHSFYSLDEYFEASF